MDVEDQKLDINAFSVLSPRTSRASVSSSSLFSPWIPQSPRNKCSLLCGAILPLQTAPKCGSAPCCRLHHIWPESHGDQTPVRRLCSLELSSLSARLETARTVLGICLGYSFVAVIKPHDQGHSGRVYLGLWPREMSLAPSHVATGRHSSTTAESSHLNHKGTDAPRRHWER